MATRPARLLWTIVSGRRRVWRGSWEELPPALRQAIPQPTAGLFPTEVVIQMVGKPQSANDVRWAHLPRNLDTKIIAQAMREVGAPVPTELVRWLS